MTGKKSAMLTYIFLLCYLTVGFAKPIVPRQANTTTIRFGLRAVRSGLEFMSIHLYPLEANGGAFWVGGPPGVKETSTYCPLVNQTLCPPGKVTQLIANPGLTGVSMNTAVPGGQQVYVAPNGALGFTQAHSAYAPPGSSFGPFNATFARKVYSVGELDYVGDGDDDAVERWPFYACPTGAAGPGPYQVFVGVEGLSNEGVPGGCLDECLGFGAVTSRSEVTGPAAWQYT